jgi:hypothetical protein
MILVEVIIDEAILRVKKMEMVKKLVSIIETRS